MNRPFLFRVIDNHHVIKYFRNLDDAISFIKCELMCPDMFGFKHKYQIYNEFTKDYVNFE